VEGVGFFESISKFVEAVGFFRFVLSSNVVVLESFLPIIQFLLPEFILD